MWSVTLKAVLAPRLKAKERGLPADSVALCMYTRNVDPKYLFKKVSPLKASGVALLLRVLFRF